WLLGPLLFGLPGACASKAPDRAASSDASPTTPSDGGVAPPAPSSIPEGGTTTPVDGAVPEPDPVPYVPFDVNHVLSTGQSNAVANGGTPVLSTSQPFANVMFDTGVMTGGSCDGDGCTTYQKPSSFVPLVEGD